MSEQKTLTAEEIAEKILYFPVTNGQAESSIFRGKTLIEQHTQAKVLENIESSMTIEEVKKVCSQIFLTIGDGGEITTDEAINTVLQNRNISKL